MSNMIEDVVRDLVAKALKDMKGPNADALDNRLTKIERQVGMLDGVVQKIANFRPATKETPPYIRFPSISVGRSMRGYCVPSILFPQARDLFANKAEKVGICLADGKPVYWASGLFRNMKNLVGREERIEHIRKRIPYYNKPTAGLGFTPSYKRAPGYSDPTVVDETTHYRWATPSGEEDIVLSLPEFRDLFGWGRPWTMDQVVDLLGSQLRGDGFISRTRRRTRRDSDK